MKQFAASLLILLLLVSLCACAGTGSAETGAAPADSRTETQPQGEPETRPQGEPETRPQGEPEAPSQGEPETRPQGEPEAPSQGEPEAPSRSEPETREVSLSLPFMETEDYVGFWSLGGMEAAAVSLRIPADWTEEAGLFYRSEGGGTRKVLEPVCLLRDMDDARWESLAGFNLAEDYGEVEYLSVSEGTDARGRDCVYILGKTWPEGDGDVVVWYPCTCYLRDPSGLTAVLVCYLSDPEDAATRAEFRAVIDSFRFE